MLKMKTKKLKKKQIKTKNSYSVKEGVHRLVGYWF